MEEKKKKKIIAFAGRKRSGKSMFALAIKQKYPNTEIIAVADQLKKLCCKIINTDLEQLLLWKDNGTTIYVETDNRVVELIHKATDIDVPIIEKEIGSRLFTSVREILQVIGTDLIRKYNPNWHIIKTMEYINSLSDDKIVVVDDVRFPNEKEVIEQNCGIVYFVIKPNNWDVSNHLSETSLSYTDFDTDKIIINDYSQLEMYDMVQDIFDCININSSPILLSNNPWYFENIINVNELNDREIKKYDTIMKYLVFLNKENKHFKEKGFICFRSNDMKMCTLYQIYILNDKTKNKIICSNLIYNPLINETLKKFINI